MTTQVEKYTWLEKVPIDTKSNTKKNQDLFEGKKIEKMKAFYPFAKKIHHPKWQSNMFTSIQVEILTEWFCKYLTVERNWRKLEDKSQNIVQKWRRKMERKKLENKMYNRNALSQYKSHFPSNSILIAKKKQKNL